VLFQVVESTGVRTKGLGATILVSLRSALAGCIKLYLVDSGTSVWIIAVLGQRIERCAAASQGTPFGPIQGIWETELLRLTSWLGDIFSAKMCETRADGRASKWQPS
jgi:hypothetical protein